MLRKLLLTCGVLASLLYIGIDVLAAFLYPEYHSFGSRMISELMASGAPTERLADPLFLLYDVLMMAFAVGLWITGARRSARVVGALLFVCAAIGLLGPRVFEMNVRGSGGNSSADALHIAVTLVLVLFILASVAVGGSVAGSRVSAVGGSSGGHPAA